MKEQQLAGLLDEAANPIETITSLTDMQLADLSDALYRRLDTPHPAFGLHACYDLVAEEISGRRLPGGEERPGSGRNYPGRHCLRLLGGRLWRWPAGRMGGRTAG